jgi:filamentous hemagglutinin family protein
MRQLNMSNQRIIGRASCVFLLICLLVSTGHAQVVRDGSIGPNASVQPVGPAFEVNEAMGEAAGSNLFHSFSSFTFGDQESVTFRASSSIANIFARVTGGAPSTIGGRLAAPGNLFLINPSGFLFNSNARVDVAGAFHATTADYIEFSTGERFSSSARVPSVLTVAAPELFGFLETNPKAPISVRADLGTPGRFHSLIGGPAFLSSNRVLAVTEDGFSDVVIDRGAGNLRLDRVFIRGGKITLTGGDVDLRNSALLSFTRQADGGAIDIQAAGRIVADGTVMINSTNGDGRGGDIKIQGGEGQDIVVGGASLIVTGTDWDGTKNVLPPSPTRPFVLDTTDLRGDGGDITLSAGRDLVTRSSVIATQNLGMATGGKVSLSAGRDVHVQEGSLIESGAEGSLFTGPVFIEAGRDVRFGGAQVTSHAGFDFFGRRGRPEALFVSAPNGAIVLERTTISTRAQSFLIESRGNRSSFVETTIPGPITLDSSVIELKSGSSLNASDVTFFETGGTITLNATDRINISGSSVESSGLGKPGRILIAAPRVLVADASRIESINAEGNDPGRISVTASDELVVADSSIRADGGLFPGVVSLAGGDINLTRSEVTSVVARSLNDVADQDIDFGINITARNLRIEGGAITARSDSAAPAGNITLLVGDTSHVTADARITTTSRSGAGGDITWSVGRFLEAIDSEISTSVLGGAGGGGNIRITMGDDSDLAIMILERSQLTARAVQGRGGNMTIVTGLFVASGEPETVVSASSELGIAGEIQIDAPDASIVGTLTTLPAVFLDAAGLIRAGCAAQRAENSASLFVRSHGGLPPAPGGLLPGVQGNIDAARAGRAPEFVGTVVGTIGNGRAVLLTVSCEKDSEP